MLNNKKLLIIISSIFVIIELTLGVLVQITSGNLNTIVSFGSVVLAFIYSIIVITKTKDAILTSIGLFFTICADIFLVVLYPRIQDLAMVFFSITQIAYFLRIINLQKNQKLRLIHIIIRCVTIVIALIATIIVLKEKTDFVSLISLFYYDNLVINLIFSFLMDEKNILFSIGLICFACCDLLIGFDIMASSYIDLKEGTLFYFLANPGFNFAWVFYVPSQLLIALSTRKISLNKKSLNRN